MCGIAGALGLAAAQRLTQRMTDAVAHRGRDANGLTTITNRSGVVSGALGHRRMAVVDLTPTGCQPMATADARFTIVFNGEIYNHRELRDELARGGAAFVGTSDTEVILAGWARHGPRFVERLRGMFAFALWDRESSTSWLARDPFGIKPLYVAAAGEGLLFASEIRAILASGMVERTISPASVDRYLAFGSMPEPHSAIAGIDSLPAGGVASVRVNGGRAALRIEFIVDPYAVRPPTLERDAAAAAGLVRDALRDSVAHHLIADVPVALFLSGGIDSSAVAAFAAEASATRLDGFTVVFREAAFDESGPARAVARRFGFRHHEIPLGAAELLAALPNAFDAMDQPSQDGLNTYVVSEAVHAAGTKVVLSGLGGDEMFAGYPAFARAARVGRTWRFLPERARSAAAAVAGALGPRGRKAALFFESDDPARGAYLSSRTLFPSAWRRELLGGQTVTAPGIASPPPGLSLLQRVSWYELTGYMRDTLLRDSDVFSMIHHLELRVPFVDRRVLEASLAIDDSLKLGQASKPLLIAALGELLPREVWDRPKQGFALPFAPWMRGELRQEVAAVLVSAERLERVGIDSRAARTLWEGFLGQRSGYSWSRPWSIYTLVRWAETLGAAVDRRPESARPRRVPAAAL